jgi:hypothetical protein
LDVVALKVFQMMLDEFDYLVRLIMVLFVVVGEVMNLRNVLDTQKMRNVEDYYKVNEVVIVLQALVRMNLMDCFVVLQHLLAA